LAKNAWKKFEKSDGFRKFKLKFKQLIGKEPKIKTDVKLDTRNYSGWMLVPQLINQGDTVYSIGICDDIAFETEIIQKRNAQIFAFDPTPYSVDWIGQQKLPENFKFFPWAASSQEGQDEAEGVTVDAFTVQSMARKLGHDHIDLLKMDIEGAEYDVIEGLLASKLSPKMLLIEFHHRFKGIGKHKTLNAVRLLRDAGYLVASVSVTGREISFVHQREMTNLK